MTRCRLHSIEDCPLCAAAQAPHGWKPYGERIGVVYGEGQPVRVRRMTAEDFDRLAGPALRRVRELADRWAEIRFGGIDTLHAITVEGPPDDWHYAQLGRVQARHAVRGDRPVDIIEPAMCEQAIDSYCRVKLMGEPTLDVITQWPLTYTRLIVPLLDAGRVVQLVIASVQEPAEPPQSLIA